MKLKTKIITVVLACITLFSILTVSCLAYSYTPDGYDSDSFEFGVNTFDVCLVDFVSASGTQSLVSTKFGDYGYKASVSQDAFSHGYAEESSILFPTYEIGDFSNISEILTPIYFGVSIPSAKTTPFDVVKYEFSLFSYLHSPAIDNTYGVLPSVNSRLEFYAGNNSTVNSSVTILYFDEFSDILSELNTCASEDAFEFSIDFELIIDYALERCSLDLISADGYRYNVYLNDLEMFGLDKRYNQFEIRLTQDNLNANTCNSGEYYIKNFKSSAVITIPEDFYNDMDAYISSIEDYINNRWDEARNDWADDYNRLYEDYKIQQENIEDLSSQVTDLEYRNANLQQWIKEHEGKINNNALGSLMSGTFDGISNFIEKIFGIEVAGVTIGGFFGLCLTLVIGAIVLKFII